MQAKVTDNSKIFKAAKDRAVEAALAAIGEEAAGNAMEELTNQDAVDTGRLHNSITYATAQHTEGKSFSWHKRSACGERDYHTESDTGEGYGLHRNERGVREVHRGWIQRISRKALSEARSYRAPRRVQENRGKRSEKCVS